MAKPLRSSGGFLTKSRPRLRFGSNPFPCRSAGTGCSPIVLFISLLKAALEDIENANSTIKGWKSRAALKILKCHQKTKTFQRSPRKKTCETPSHVIAAEGPRRSKGKRRRTKPRRKPRKQRRQMVL